MGLLCLGVFCILTPSLVFYLPKYHAFMIKICTLYWTHSLLGISPVNKVCCQLFSINFCFFTRRMRHGHTVGVGLFLGRLSPSDTFASQNFCLGKFQKVINFKHFKNLQNFTKKLKIKFQIMSKCQKS